VKLGLKGRRYDAGLVNLFPKTVEKCRRQVEEDTFVTHHFKLLVGHTVAVLDGIYTRVNGHLDVQWRAAMDRNFKVLAVSLINYRGDFVLGKTIVDGNLNNVDIVKDICPHGLSCFIDVVN